MARNETVSCPPKTWVEITNANAASATFVNRSPYNHMQIMGTVGAVAPADANVGIPYPPMKGEGNEALTTLFPGLPGVNRLYAWFDLGGEVFVSHA